MAIPHATPGQAFDVRPLGKHLPSEKTRALFKSCDLEVMRLVLLAGKSLPAHQVAGDITIQCLDGRLRIQLERQEVVLQAGEMVLIAGSATHSLTALTDASALVTITLKLKDAAPEAASTEMNSVANDRPDSWDGLFVTYATTTVPADFMGEADRDPVAHDRDPFADLPKSG